MLCCLAVEAQIIIQFLEGTNLLTSRQPKPLLASSTILLAIPN